MFGKKTKILNIMFKNNDLVYLFVHRTNHKWIIRFY